MGAFVMIILAIYVCFFIFDAIQKRKKKFPKPISVKPLIPIPSEPEFILTYEFKEILELLNESKKIIFLTGKAGTGKSSLLKYFLKNTNKKCVVLAPTGIAALNVGGQTIHSFFKFPAKNLSSKIIHPWYVKAELFRCLEMVIIDEVSMVSSDLLNGIDIALRKNRNVLDKPFGGIQMVFIGDLFQLPPIINDENREHIETNYGGEYFFDAPVFDNFHFEFKELTKVFRQSEGQEKFVSLLNKVRVDLAGFEEMVLLNSRHVEHVGQQKKGICLTTKRSIARSINFEKIEELDGYNRVYTGILMGEYLKLLNEKDKNKVDDQLPAPLNLELKVNAQIMMVRNDPGKRWVNGSLGKVTKLENDVVTVVLDGKTHKVERETWNETEYILNPNTQKIEEKIIPVFTQFPMQLAYAITIHKSQGKTFDNITVDIGSGTFAHGQIYVALSRCTTFEGIVLNNAINNKDIFVDKRVISFYETKIIPPKKQIIVRDINVHDIIINAIESKKAVRITYENFNGELSERTLSDLKISDQFKEFGYSQQHITAFCHTRKEERSFKINRIKKAELLF